MKYAKYIAVFILAYIALALIDVLFGDEISYYKNLSLSVIGLIGLFFQHYYGNKKK